jgi:hypothetical protein
MKASVSSLFHDGEDKTFKIVVLRKKKLGVTNEMVMKYFLENVF